jgi:DNA-binding transcriptional MerR regulator
MTIGELARRGGVTVQGIRFYERSGLMEAPARSDSGYRLYDASDLRRLKFILQAKRLGFSLEEIKSILRMRDRGDSPCDEVVGMAERHLAEAEGQIIRLTRFRDELSRTLALWKRSRGRTVAGGAICVLIERTLESGGEKDGQGAPEDRRPESWSPNSARPSKKSRLPAGSARARSRAGAQT